MKRFACVLLVSLILPLAGCGAKQNATTVDADVESTYTSVISAEDCYLCREQPEDAVTFLWGQNNVALISLNTFEIRPLEINRYDRWDGRLIEEYAGVLSFGGGGSQDGGFAASLMLDYDRGYATGSVDFYDDEVLNVSRAANFLCEDCLNGILTSPVDRCFGVGVVNLVTKEVRVFEEHLSGFTLGDFYIDCNLKDPDGDNRQMDLLIFYCPVRYKNES